MTTSSLRWPDCNFEFLIPFSFCLFTRHICISVQLVRNNVFGSDDEITSEIDCNFVKKKMK